MALPDSDNDKITNDDKRVGTAESPNPDTEKKEVKEWLKTITRVEKSRDQSSTFNDASRFINEYKGKWDWLAMGVSIPLIPINLVFAYVKTEIARLYFRDPWITVNPKRVEDIGAARIAEQVVNYVWGELDLKRQIKLALIDALLVGHGWIKVGYTAEFGTVESRPKARKPGRPPKEEAIVDTSEFIRSEDAFAYHIPYKNVIFDPGATWPVSHSARWMAVKWEKPLRAIQESGIYKHVDDIRPTEADEKDPQQFKDIKIARGWEIYDLDHMKVITVSQGCEYKLREIDYPDYLKGGFPLVEFSFNPVPGEQYALSDIAPHEPQIIELTKMMAIMINHLKRWNRQIFMKPGLMTDENKNNFKNATDGAIIEIQGDPTKDFFIPPYAAVQQDIYGVWNLCMDMWKNVCGQTAMERGAEGRAATRTIGELRLQLQGGKARSDEKVDVLEESIAEVARKLLSIMQTKYDLPKIARIVGPRNIQKAIQARPTAQPTHALGPQSYTSKEAFSWNKDDIKGEMDVDVLAGSTAPMDRESQLSMMEKLIPLLPAAGISPGTPAARAYAREFLRLIGIPALENVMDLAEQQPPQPPPKMMEIQAKLKSKQAETQLKTQAKQQELQLKGQESKIKMEGIKAKTQADIVKAQLDVQKAHRESQKSILDHLLSTVRGPSNGNGNPNGE